MTHKYDEDAKTNPTCTKCGADLNIDNWYPSLQKTNHYICKRCNAEQSKQWRKANPEKAKDASTRHHRKEGCQPMNENKKCTAFLGVHVAERVLSHVFKNVQQMPYGNPGYDFICGGGHKIDVKSSCRQTHEENWADSWGFIIKKNKIAEYFLCLAFDNRESLNPEHIWLIPCADINDHVTARISESTIVKWDEYKLDVKKVMACCNMLQYNETKRK